MTPGRGSVLRAQPSPGARPLPRGVVDRIRRTRRHPRPTQFDYLHLRYLVQDLEAALGRLDRPPRDVLDVYCGSRPYEDLLPGGARCTGLDVIDSYGVADVVSDVFLPFPDDSFDLVLCVEAFHYVADSARGVGEIARVLRPGGWAIVTVPLVWEYNREILEHRFTGPELVALFVGWDDVQVVENGGRAVAWATLTGSLLDDFRRELAARLPGARLLEATFAPVYMVMNGLASLAERLDRRRASPLTLPMNLLISARRPG